MTGRRTPRPVLRIVLPLLLMTIPQCKCGGQGDEPPAGSGAVAELYRSLFADLPKADVKHPAEALPQDLVWVAASPDAEAWRAWASQQAFVQALMQTPLYADLLLSAEWRTLEGLQTRTAQAAKLTGEGAQRGLLWAGPTAVGIAEDLDGEGRARRHVLLVKSITPQMGALVQFAAAFGTLSRSTDSGLTLERSEVEDIPVHTWTQGARTLSFALFRDLLVAGDDLQWVQRAVALAAGEPKDGDKGCQDRLPPAATPGVHLSLRPVAPHPAALLGVEHLGLSLVNDPAAPVVLRRTRADKASADRLQLLKYAPESTFLALVDGGRPSGALLSGIKARLAGPAKLGPLDLEAELLNKLSPGMGLLFSAQPNPASPGGVLVLCHEHQDLEPVVRTILEAVSDSKVQRTLLDSGVKATLLSPKGGGLAAALTDDALLVAMSDEALRAALAAGQAQAPSLKDRKLDLSPGAESALYLDFSSMADFLGGFTQQHAGHDDEADVLKPTLDAVRKGGRSLARLSRGEGDFEEGALRVLP